MKIRVGVVIAALTLSFLGPLAHATDSTDESWTIPNIVDPGIHGALFQDYDDGEKFSYLIDPNILNQHKS